MRMNREWLRMTPRREYSPWLPCGFPEQVEQPAPAQSPPHERSRKLEYSTSLFAPSLTILTVLTNRFCGQVWRGSPDMPASTKGHGRLASADLPYMYQTLLNEHRFSCELDDPRRWWWSVSCGYTAWVGVTHMWASCPCLVCTARHRRRGALRPAQHLYNPASSFDHPVTFSFFPSPLSVPPSFNLLPIYTSSRYYQLQS